MRLRDYAVDGLIPSVVIRPETAEQVAAVLQWAEGEKLAVLPRGSGTAIRLGSMAKRLDIVLSTSRLTQISEHDAANFTITAGAGMTCSQVAQVTAADRQMLPLQYPFSAATLGGLIAANAYSPKRMLYGGVRDLLLGLRIALPSGEIAHFGGKVVKNVAGYDMCKLFVGSLGALGVIVEATFKLYALPERDETLLAEFPSLGQSAAAVARLTGTQLLPSQILLLNSIAARAIVPQRPAQVAPGTALLLVNCEGMDEAVERQLADIAWMCQGHGASTVQVLSGEAQLQLRQRLAAMTQVLEDNTSSPAAQPSRYEAEGAGGGALTVRLGTPPSRVYTLMKATAQALNPITPGVVIIGDCGVGLVTLCLSPDGLAAGAIEARLLPALRELRRLVVALGGYAVVESAPPAMKTPLEVWGPTPSSVALLKALKDRFDPEAVLSPGRFIGGL
ncbi:MAG TPA: FAD-binding oxidoreductase [Candidatus Tectomicrobia bacterium]